MRARLEHANLTVRDAEGNDWEFVEYRSQDRAERSDHAIEDTR